ncbi:thiol:disulfide interchange protein DsbA/DsbL [Paraferrimonas haliotis]|uniref:Thiol:disulfide interchange protein n=1 Tax=Paraferrimonas haliotis TaxID=2013866 RepID=A0AA37TM73_9GAMM|nr:thiol:disulfide interchange protein DsbA/DsbL [Paraferrimonas haliotis]GLS82118.1 thiol:disulfide interchange protein [Paraferrimonas haliotis]
MKKLMACLVALMMVPMAAFADFKEGVNYDIINQGKATATPEVREFFSFYCPHCYTFDKGYIPTLKAKLKESSVPLKQNHVDFIGREMGVEMSKAFAIAEQLGVLERIKPAMFAAIHDYKRPPATAKQIRDLFIANDVKPEDYDKAASSFMVQTQLAQMEQRTKNAKISGVPTFVVNGKYRVNTQSIKSFEELTDLIMYLTKKD